MITDHLKHDTIIVHAFLKVLIPYLKDHMKVDKVIEARFLHSHGPAKSFYWPREEDKCWVPRHHVLYTVPVPHTSGLGRHYKFS